MWAMVESGAAAFGYCRYAAEIHLGFKTGPASTTANAEASKASVSIVLELLSA